MTSIDLGRRDEITLIALRGVSLVCLVPGKLHHQCLQPGACTAGHQAE
jgi:hypothetical protein